LFVFPDAYVPVRSFATDGTLASRRIPRNDALQQIGDVCPAGGSVGVWACVCYGSSGSSSSSDLGMKVDYTGHGFTPLAVPEARDFIVRSALSGTK